VRVTPVVRARDRDIRVRFIWLDRLELEEDGIGVNLLRQIDEVQKGMRRHRIRFSDLDFILVQMRALRRSHGSFWPSRVIVADDKRSVLDGVKGCEPDGRDRTVLVMFWFRAGVLLCCYRLKFDKDMKAALGVLWDPLATLRQLKDSELYRTVLRGILPLQERLLIELSDHAEVIRGYLRGEDLRKLLLEVLDREG